MTVEAAKIGPGVRSPIRLIRAQPTSDGAGVSLNRVFPAAGILQLDPFLLFDEFGSSDPDAYIAGFPDHPHRGFETVTYMLAGRMRHRDHAGNSGLLTAGGAQWMTAGRGVIHSEMPEQSDGLMRGFQIWVNLPAAEKMIPARYQDYAPDAIPTVALPDGGSVRVVAGEIGGTRGPVSGVSRDPLLVDLRLKAGASWEAAIGSDRTTLAYVFEGQAQMGEVLVPSGTMAVLGPGGLVRIHAKDASAAVLILAARPIGEPVVRAGPFVMNTREEILQAFRDYETGKLV